MPPSNPKHPNFHYYNIKKSYYFDKNNNKQKVSFPIFNPGPSDSWYCRYHPVSTQYADYDKFIFQSILYRFFFDSINHTTTSIASFVNSFDVSSIASFVDSFDVLQHYNLLQNLHTATILPYYKSQPTASPPYQRILLEARDVQHSLTFTCGTIFRFPIQKESNLPIMLSQEALNKPKSKCVHVTIRNPIINAMQFLCSTTHAIFMTGILLHYVDKPSVLVTSSAA